MFAVVYLMYAPIQWIAWANFHPEALVITPMLFAWWFATRRTGAGASSPSAVALSTREDAALAVFMIGFVLLVTDWRSADATRSTTGLAIGDLAIGVVWYLICMRLVIPHFNRGQQPFYIEYFYGNYGASIAEIVRDDDARTRPGRARRHPARPLRFYRDLAPAVGRAAARLAPLQLPMALPQMLASVIGLSPYARMIRYQYTAMMIAPIVIAAIEGAALAVAVTGSCGGADSVAAGVHVRDATSPGRRRRSAPTTTWRGRSRTPRHELIRQAMKLVPDDASVTATYGILPHLSHREQIYDWPNPLVDGVLRQRRRLPPARPERDRVHHPRPHAGRATPSSRWSTRLIAGRRLRGAVQPGRHPRRTPGSPGT